MANPSGKLEKFDGWDDPPLRSHTSASILIPDEREPHNVKSHVLIDVGAGVVDSLVSSKLLGLEKIQGILISHLHPDHVLGLNQLCGSLRRSLERKGKKFFKIPVYCTMETYRALHHRYSSEFNKALNFHKILPEVSFKVNETPPVIFKALEIGHGNVKGSVIYIADIGPKKAVFCWDIDVPDAERPSDRKKNIEIIDNHLDIFKNVDLLLMASNTWEAIEGAIGPTGHTSYVLARKHYIKKIGAKRVLLVHLSGHEDKNEDTGYGWNDSRWETAVRKHGLGIARQGMLIEI